MTIHDAHSALTKNNVRLEIDLAKLDALSEEHMPLDDILHAIREHLADHKALLEEIEQAMAPHMTQQLPYHALQ